MKTNVNFTPREKLLRGVDIMADAVSATLGPVSSSVAIAKANYKGDIYERIVLKDGVSVARAIDLEDEDENMGAQLLKEASQKQVDAVGDGTTVVMVLAQAIIHECFTLIASGVNGMGLRKGLEAGQKTLLAELTSKGTKITGSSQTKYIATISAEDETLGALVSDALAKQGVDGIIAVEESKNTETVTEYQKGMQLDRGFVHQYFVTNPNRMEAVLEDARVLVTDMPINSLVPLEKILNAVATSDKKLVIFAPDFDTEALGLLVNAKMEGKLLPLCVKVQAYLQHEKECLQDIGVLVGAKVISADAGHKFTDATVEWLGKAQNITADKNQTVIVGGGGKSEDIDLRATSIKNQIDISEEFEKVKQEERLAKLTTGVCVIRVGGVTEIEMKERRERVLDAVAATKAALKTGIVPGGETIYLRLREALHPEKSMTDGILYRALEKPITKLLSNAGLDSGAYIEKLRALDGKIDNVGIDVTSLEPGVCKDMIQVGIIDPLAVPYNAIINAISVATQIVASNVVITPLFEEKKG